MVKMKKITILLYLLITLISSSKVISKTAVNNNVKGLTEKEDLSVTIRNVSEEKSTLNLDELLNESELMPDHSNYSSKDSFLTVQYYKTPKRDKESSKNNDEFTLKIIKIHTTPSYEINKLEMDRNNREVPEVQEKQDENKLRKSIANVNEINKIKNSEKKFEKDATTDSNVRSSVDDIMNEFKNVRRNNVPIEKLDENTKIHSIVEDAEKEIRADANLRMSLDELKRDSKSDHRNSEPIEKLDDFIKVRGIEEDSEVDVPFDSSLKSTDDVHEFENGRRNNKPIQNLKKNTAMDSNTERLVQKDSDDIRGKSSVGNNKSEEKIKSTRKNNELINKPHDITDKENISENIKKEAEPSFKNSDDDNGDIQDLEPVDSDNDSVEYFKENEYPFQKSSNKVKNTLKETGDLPAVRTDSNDVSNLLAKPQERNIEPVAAPKSAITPEYIPTTNDNNDKDQMDIAGLVRLLQTKINKNPGVPNVQANPVGLRTLLDHKTNRLDPYSYSLLPVKIENSRPLQNYQETITQLKSSKMIDDFTLRKFSILNPYMPLTPEKILQGNIALKNNPTVKLIHPLINLRNIINLNKQNLLKRQFTTFRPNIVAMSRFGYYSS